MEATLTQLLEDARRDVLAAHRRMDLHAARHHEGRADGIAETMEALGLTPTPWKPRPRIAVDLSAELQPCPCRHT
jgi:hypothetical protein